MLVDFLVISAVKLAMNLWKVASNSFPDALAATANDKEAIIKAIELKNIGY